MKSIKERLKIVLNELLTLSKVYKKPTVFTIGIAPRKREIETVFFPFIRESSLSVIGNAEVNNLEEAKEIVKIIDGIVDYIFIDDEKKSSKLLKLTSEIKSMVKDSIVLTYKDNDAWVEATDALVSLFLDDNLNKNILIITINNLSLKLAIKLCERGSNTFLMDNLNKIDTITEMVNALNFILPPECPSKIQYCDKLSDNIHFDVIIGFSIDETVIDLEFIKKITPKTIIIDAGIGSLSESAIKYALDNDIIIFRLDMRAGLSGNIINVIETYDLKENVYGMKKFQDFNIVAGGYFGLKGDIVVDSITNPIKVIGVADGKGHLLSRDQIKKFESRIRAVEADFTKEISTKK